MGRVKELKMKNILNNRNGKLFFYALMMALLMYDIVWKDFKNIRIFQILFVLVCLYQFLIILFENNSDKKN
jgi:hypothetical protein